MQLDLLAGRRDVPQVLPSRDFSICPHPDESREFEGDDALDERFAAEASIGEQMYGLADVADFRWKSAQELQRQLGGRGLSLAPPDQEGPRKAQLSAAEVQQHDVNAMHRIQGVHPIAQSLKAAFLGNGGQIDDQFKPWWTPDTTLSVGVQLCVCMLPHDPNHGGHAPRRVIQEAAQGRGGFDRCIRWEGFPHRCQEEIKQHLNVVQMLLTLKRLKDVRIKLSSTCFLCVHTLILRGKAVLDVIFVNRKMSDDRHA